MAGSLSKSSLFSGLRFHSQKAEPGLHLPRRGYHIELGAREKALLEEDPALKKFKSYKNTVKRVSKIGDALTVIVVADAGGKCKMLAAMRFMQWRQQEGSKGSPDNVKFAK